MKKTFLPLALLLSLLISSCAFNSTPKIIESEYNQEESYERFPAAVNESCADLLTTFFSAEKFKVKDEKIVQIKNIVKEAIASLPEANLARITDYSSAIEESYKAIMKSGKTSLKKGEQMAQMGQKLRKLYLREGYDSEALRDLDYLLGRSVLKAEAYLPSEFKVATDADIAMGKNSQLLHINYKQYKDYTISFEDKTALYKNLNQAGGTVIQRHDIREMEALNRFPVYLDHDMKHVRYALHHERYFPMLFAAARGKNDLRYVMMGALSEGIDTFQYSEESAICTFFDVTKGLDLEEAMLWIGRATDEELTQVAEEIGHLDTFQDLVKNEYKDWKPVTTPTFSAMGQSGDGLEKELDDMTRYLRKQHTDPKLKERYKNRESKILHY